jgi:DNA polymerase III delta prime subunit
LSTKGESLFVLNLNPPTERGIDKVLKCVAEGEELCVSDGQLVDIRNQCNRDLRNAMVTLQFMAAGRTMEGLLQSQ